MRRVAILIRGVNVGGNGKLPMAELCAFLTDLGYAGARTLLASGNAVIATDEPLDALETRLEAAARERLGRDLVILARDAAALDALIAGNPHRDAAIDHPQHVMATFHRVAVDPALLAALAESHHGPEVVVPVGRELVTDYPVAIADSKLDAAMRRLKFPAIATTRNWNTVLKLRAMLDG